MNDEHIELDRDLKEVIETLEELKRSLQQRANTCAQLARENTALSRRLAETRAAEQRHRRRAAASRAVTMRAQAAARSAITAYNEIARQKGKLADQRKKHEEDRRYLEAKIDALQKENVRLTEEAEGAQAAAAIAAAASAAADVSQLKGPHRAATNQHANFADSAPSRFVRRVPLVSRSPRPSICRPGTSMWTRNGSLAWNRPAVNLSTGAACTHSQRATQRAQAVFSCSSTSSDPGSGASRAHGPPPAAPECHGFQTARQLITSQSQRHNQLPDSADSNELHRTTLSPDPINDESQNQQEALKTNDEEDCIIMEENVTQKTEQVLEEAVASSSEVAQVPVGPQTTSEESVIPAPVSGIPREISLPDNEPDVIQIETSSRIMEPTLTSDSMDKVGSTQCGVQSDGVPSAPHKKVGKKKLYSGPLRDDFVPNSD